jgi:hypothetical protein
VVGILRLLADQLRLQRGRGSEYFIGTRLSALDLVWPAFSNMLAPLPHELCPMPDYMRKLYTVAYPDVKAALDPLLFEHRDRLFRDVIGLPLDF